MRIFAVIVLALAALGFGAATSVVRNAPADNKLMFTIGAMSLPILLLIVGMVLWERGGKRPPPQRPA
jgi:hypothetical protein